MTQIYLTWVIETNEMQQFHTYDYIPYIHFSERKYAPKRKSLRAGLSNAMNRY